MDYNSDTDPSLNPTNRKYGLSLRVKKVKKSAYQGMGERLWDTKNEYTAIVLELLPSERQNGPFIHAWVPDVRPEYDEMGNIIKNHPPEVVLELEVSPYGSARCFVMRVDKDSPEYPYLLVASVGVEQDIDYLYKNGDMVRAVSFPSTEDYEGDRASDTSYSHEHYGE